MTKLKKFYQENKLVLIIIFCFTILTFGYFGVSTVINNDGVLDFIIDDTTNAGYKLYLSVGRWGWALIGIIFKYYPVPFLFLIMNAVLFSLATVYLCRIFKIEKNLHKILIGMLLVSFPINAYAYSYSGWQNSIGIAFFSAIYATYLLKNSNKKIQYLLCTLLFAFVISIYQMFLPYLAVLLVFISILEISSNTKLKEAFKKILKYFIIFVCGCILYYIIVKLSTLLFNIKMNNYQNANTMFNFNLLTILNNFPVNFIQSFVVRDLYFFPLVSHILLIILVVFNYLQCIKNTRKNAKIIVTILLILLVIAPQIIRFVKPDQWFHEVTLISYTIFYAGNIALLFTHLNRCSKKINNIVIVSLIFIIISFVIADNKAGVMAKNASNSAFYYANRLQTRIEALDGYTNLKTKNYYFVGKYRFYEFPYSKRAYTNATGITTNFVFDTRNFVDAINVMGIDAIYYNDLIDKETKQELKNITKDLKAYPDKEGLFIYNDIIVIKMK